MEQGFLLPRQFIPWFPCRKDGAKPPGVEEPMTTLQIAIVAFAAGFLSCAALAATIVLWSFADRRADGFEPLSTSKRQQQRAA
jgi:hypothetical protein